MPNIHRPILPSIVRAVSVTKVNDVKDREENLFIGPQEFVVGYSKAP